MKFFSPLAALMLLGLSLLSYEAFSADSPSLSASPAPALVASSPASGPLVVVAEPSAPPAWAQDLIVSAQKLPVIGPVVSKAFLYLGIISSILTMLAGFLISACAALSGAFNYAGLTNAVVAITDFQNGKIMYYLKFFSLFNAKKPDPQ